MADKLSRSQIRARLRELPRWTIRRDSFTPIPSLRRELRFRSFAEALRFVDEVGKLAGNYGHHPDIHLIRYSNVVISIYTHSVKGLTTWDFELAHLMDKIQTSRKPRKSISSKHGPVGHKKP